MPENDASPLRQAFELLLAAADAGQQHQVFDILLAAAPPERQREILRTAIATLIAKEAIDTAARCAPFPEPAAPPGHRTKNRRHQGRFEPADPTRWAELHPQLKERLRSAADIRAAAPALGLGATSLRRVLNRQRRPGAAVLKKAEAWLKQTPAPASHETPPDPSRLSLAQRDLLTVTRQHDLPSIRRGARVTEEQVDQVIAGEAVDPAVVSRLSAFLAR